MPTERRAIRTTVLLFGLASAGWFSQTGPAAAFPVADPITPSVVPMGADLAAPDVQDLRHQMALLSGFGTAGIGWTILPRVTVEEIFNDNILQTQSPRRWDLITVVSPGVAVLGDTGHVQLRLDYEPSLNMHVRTGSQNALTQQLNATGLVTVVQDLFYVDVRAIAGVQATNGGIGGVGGLGQAGVGPINASALVPTNPAGVPKENRTQTSSFSLSPYVLYKFGDIGNGKVGVSFNRSAYAFVTGFAPIPYLSSSANAQTRSSVEETASFQSGDFFGDIRDSATANASQGTSYGALGGKSSRETASNRMDYAISHTLSVYVSLGWESINYGGANALNINGPTWSVGSTFTPDPDSSLTIGYGRQNGRTSLTFNGRYALTTRTTLTASYTNGIGTQLEQVQNQLNAGAVANNGSLVNSQTGGPLFTGNNALGVQPGIFRFSTLSASATTVLDRDTFTLTLGSTESTQIGRGAASTTNTARTISLTWARQLTPALAVNASAFYSLGSPVAALGSSRSLAANASLQYTISDTLSAFARYSYYDRQSSAPGLSMYQDLMIFGVTKQF